MRSVVALLAYCIGFYSIPTIFMQISDKFFTGNKILAFVCQIASIFLLIFLFVKSRELKENYEKKTLEMIEKVEDIEKLKELRKNRISYRSKAEITKKILNLEYSYEETQNLKKYTTKKSDMVFYYSKIIANEREKREEYKIRRDNFNKKYERKRFVFVDFKDSLYTTLKRLAVFFVLSFLAYKRPYASFLGQESYFTLAMLNFVLNFVVMINTIVRIFRTMRIFWVKDYI
jgi:uncharacterized membrane protein